MHTATHKAPTTRRTNRYWPPRCVHTSTHKTPTTQCSNRPHCIHTATPRHQQYNAPTEIGRHAAFQPATTTTAVRLWVAPRRSAPSALLQRLRIGGRNVSTHIPCSKRHFSGVRGWCVLCVCVCVHPRIGLRSAKESRRRENTSFGISDWVAEGNGAHEMTRAERKIAQAPKYCLVQSKPPDCHEIIVWF